MWLELIKRKSSSSSKDLGPVVNAQREAKHTYEGSDKWRYCDMQTTKDSFFCPESILSEYLTCVS